MLLLGLRGVLEIPYLSSVSFITHEGGATLMLLLGLRRSTTAPPPRAARRWRLQGAVACLKGSHHKRRGCAARRPSAARPGAYFVFEEVRRLGEAGEAGG